MPVKSKMGKRRPAAGAKGTSKSKVEYPTAGANVKPWEMMAKPKSAEKDTVVDDIFFSTGKRRRRSED